MIQLTRWHISWYKTCIVMIFTLFVANFAVLPSAVAAEVLYFSAGDGQSFIQYSTRLSLDRDFYSMNINGGTRPYSFSMTNPIVTITPHYPGAQVAFKVTPKTVGTTVLTIKDSAGNSIQRELVVYDPGAQPLSLSALPDASNPVAVGQGRGFSVSGGKPPYKVVSANTGIARVEPSGVLYTVWGVAAGTTQITVTDAAGTQVQRSVVVGTTKPLYISADSTLLSGGKGELTISSGNPPYTVTTSTQLTAVLKGDDSYGRTVYTLTAVSPGQGTVTVKDSKGQSASHTVTVKEWISLEFPELTASPRTIDVGQTTKMLVKGGVDPHSVSAIPESAVQIVKLADGQYSVTGRQAAVVRMIAKDTTGTSRELSLIVRDLPTLTVLAPQTLTLGGSNGTLSFIGGAAPFTVTVSGNQLALTKLEEKRYQLTPRALGTATITVQDSKGTTVQKSVTVTGVPLKLELSAPTLNLGHTGVLDIKGGTGPYTVTLSGGIAKAEHLATNPTYTRYNVTGIAPGTADIMVRDSSGATATAKLIIQSEGLKITVSSNTLKLGETGVLSIQGGVGPYAATLSGNQLALPQLNTYQYRMIPQSPGIVTVTIRDNMGVRVSQNITIQMPGPNPLTIQLASSTVRRGQPLEVRLLGGTGPYRLVQEGGPPLQMRQTGPNIFVVTGIYAGMAPIRAIDARGQYSTVNITIVD